MSSQKESEFLRSERRMSFEGCSSIPLELHPNGLLGPPLGLSTPCGQSVQWQEKRPGLPTGAALDTTHFVDCGAHDSVIQTCWQHENEELLFF